jgi:hypothetical protein
MSNSIISGTVATKPIPSLEVSGSASALNADIIPSTLVSGYRSMSIQFTGAFVAAYTFQTSNDNINWLPMPLCFVNSTAGYYRYNVTTPNFMLFGQVIGKYFRCRCTAYTSGTGHAIAEFHTSPTGPLQVVSLTYNQACTSGGALKYALNSANSTNATNVKNVQTHLYGYSISNTSVSPIYFKIYDKANTPIVGTDVPALRIMIPAGNSVTFSSDIGVVFNLGLGFGCTTGVADNNTGAVGAGDVLVNLYYK